MLSNLKKQQKWSSIRAELKMNEKAACVQKKLWKTFNQNVKKSGMIQGFCTVLDIILCHFMLRSICLAALGRSAIKLNKTG